MDAWIDCAPFERLLNMKIVSAENGRAILTMPFLVQYAQGAGLMHGGALAALADTAVVMAIKSILSPGTHFATISMESKFLYPVKQGVVTAKASATQEKERTFSGRATVYNEEDKAVMEFASIFKIANSAPMR
jgi:uncharacterized protein (TIGR00369 family)